MTKETRDHRLGELAASLRDFRKTTPLHEAVESGDPAAVSACLDTGADIEAGDRGGATALMLAAGLEETQMARLLLERGASLQTRDNEGKTPLMIAAEKRKRETVRLFLEQGADLFCRTERGGSVLMAAARGGDPEIARLLLERGAEVNAYSQDNSTALLWAAMCGHAVMIALLKESGAEIGFLEAVALGDIEWAKNLPDETTSPRMAQWGQSLLLWAARESRADIIQLLQERGVSASPSSRNGPFALMRAIWGGSGETVAVLLERGADPNATDPTGQKALQIAEGFGKATEVVALLKPVTSVPDTPWPFRIPPESITAGKGIQDLREALQKLLDQIQQPPTRDEWH